MFIDGVYRCRIGIGLTELGPVDRVEVLRGPQGTLFGRNASAGLIHVITAKPQFTTEVYGEATIGNYNLRRIDARRHRRRSPIRSPPASTASTCSATASSRTSFRASEVNDRNRWLLRGQILYQPTDDFLGPDHRRLHQAQRRMLRGGLSADRRLQRDQRPDTGFASPRPSQRIIEARPRRTASIIDDPYDRDMSITPGRSYNSDVVDYGVSARSQLRFRRRRADLDHRLSVNDFERGQDADFNNLDILYRDGSGGSANKFKTFTQELRLQGKAFNDRLDWLVGGYSRAENLRVKDNLAYGADYARYANCLVANRFRAQSATGQAGAWSRPATRPASTPRRRPLLLPFVAGRLAADGVRRLRPARRRSPMSPLSPFTNSGFTNVASPSAAACDLQRRRDRRSVRAEGHQLGALHPQHLLDHRRLKLTAGVRYTHETQEARRRASATTTRLCAFFSGTPRSPRCRLALRHPARPGGNFSFESDTKKESKWTGTVALSWKPIDEILLYGSVSRGYKAGGFNLDRSALPRSRHQCRQLEPRSRCSTACGRAASSSIRKSTPPTNSA